MIAAAFPPMPPETDRGAGVFVEEPMYTPESKSEERIVLPDPAGVRVRLLFPVVPIAAFAPPPRLNVVAETPSVPAEVMVASDESVSVDVLIASVAAVFSVAR